MSKIDYEAMPTAEETKRWALSSDQRKLLAAIIDKPRPYETNGLKADELRRLSDSDKSKPGVVTLFYPSKTGNPIWQATAAGYGLMAQSLPDKLKKHAAEYYRARNWGRVDRLPTQVCSKCGGTFKAGWYDTSDRCGFCFDYTTDAQHFSEVRFEQDGGGREGWASTDPGRTKYHHYDASGNSKCSYQRQHGPLHFAPDPKQLTQTECCSSCDLAILKAKQPVPPPRQPAPPKQKAQQLSLF